MLNYNTIAVGTDGSPTSLRAVQAAASMARVYDAKLIIVSAFYNQPGAMLGAPDSESLPVIDRTDAQSYLDNAASIAQQEGAESIEVIGKSGEPDELFNELFRTVVDLGFKVPPAIAAAFRCLGVLEGTLKLLDPECDVVTTARTTAKELFQEQLDPIAALESGIEQTALAAPLVERLPARMSSIVERLDRENLGLDFSPFRSVQSQITLNHFGQLLSLSVLTTISALCGIAMVLSDRGPQWSDT